MNPQKVVENAALLGSGIARYLSSHPEEVIRVVKNAAFLKFGVPLPALRWLAAQAKGKKAPKDVQIEAVPPGLRIGATVDLMGTTVRASVLAVVENVNISNTEVRLELRLADVSLSLVGDSDSPVATLLKSRALDLSKPGNLVAYMPKRPKWLVAAEGDRVVVDLQKHPAIAANPQIQRALRLITPVITVTGIESDWEHLDIVCKAFKGGFSEAFNTALSVVREVRH